MADKTTKKLPVASPQNFPIVGIGASSGGLDAFRRLLEAIPENSGMAYVLVQHLDPKHESILSEILSKSTKIPLNEISDDIHLSPNNIYVIPSNKTLTATDGVLKLKPRSKMKANLVIDVFFTSLAEIHKHLAVGIVLSGNGSDGTLGLKAIKEHEGVTFAQDQQSAAYGQMPESAVRAGVVDFVLPPDKIPAKLIKLLGGRKNHPAKVQDNPIEEALPKNNEEYFKQIISVLRQHNAVDFTYYKQTTVRRRIARRMLVNKKVKLSAYLKFLRSNKAEQEALFQDMLIPVTTFFRDKKIFQTIKTKLFPILLKSKVKSKSIRIWVAGCSTGEEAYSFIILLHEFLGKKLADYQIQIFASDISEIAIKKARIGVYTKAELVNVPALILKKYFKKSGETYQINKSIRDVCLFAIHNFIKDPPFAKIDLISCRNVLIYMETFLQEKALNTFHYALNETGLLILGKSETTGASSDLFLPVVKNDKMYRRKSVPGNFVHMTTKRKDEIIVKKNERAPRLEIKDTDFRKSAESILLSKYMPANVIINEQMDIVYINGFVTPFLEQAQGKPTFNLLKMAREGLSFELRNALHKAKTSDEPVIKDGIIVKYNGKIQQVTIEILQLTNIVEPHFMVLFRKTEVPEKKDKLSNLSISTKIKNAVFLARIDQLEKELSQNNEDVRFITEDQEASNEELQSTNEELLSGSEELQSLNEELETSKEELQSSNEELTINNQQLVEKQEQINSARLYTESIITTIREPLVVLDESLRIKTINASFSKKFNITDREALRKSIFEIQNHLFNNLLLKAELEKVLIHKVELNDYELLINLRPYGESTMLINARPVISEKNKEQLILLAIEDITERKKLTQQMKTFSDGLEIEVLQRTASLEQTNLQLEQFAHTASHELQEPLRKIITFSKVLKQDFKEGKKEEVIKYLDKLEESSVRMSELVQHLLEFSGVGQQEKIFTKTDLNEILKDILDDFELLITEKKAVIKIGHLPTLQAVPFEMHQLFYDLMSNALKFSKRMVAPVIHISSRELTKDEIGVHSHFDKKMTYFEIIMEDNGIGFDQKYAHKIFTMFQRLNVNNKYSGTGIGLALCKKIVNNYHGEIFAKGKDNEGSFFHIILPFEQLKVSKNAGELELKQFGR